MSKTLSEQVAELERRLAAKNAHIERIVKAAQDDDEYWAKKFAQAREEGREAALRAAKDAAFRVCSDFLRENGMRYPRDWRGSDTYGAESVDREYPATGKEPTRGEPSVFRTDSAFANSLRVGGSCADCQALNAEASVTWKTCPKHTLNLRASESGDTTQGSRVDFRTLDNRGVKEVLSDPAPPQAVPEPPQREVLLTTTTHRTGIVAIVTHADARRIVALASRPTQPETDR